MNDDARSALSHLETAAVVIGLSNKKYTDFSSRGEASAFSFKHGGSLCSYDKQFNLIIFADGAYTSNAEHTVADGTVGVGLLDRTMEIGRMIEREVFEMGRGENTGVLEKGATPPCSITPVVFNMTKQEEEECWNAKQENIRVGQAIDIHVMEGDSHLFEPSVMKESAIPRDTLMQVGLQLAYYRVAGRISAVYESAATRRLQYGRTETIHSCLPSTVEFIRYFSLHSSSMQNDGEKQKKGQTLLRQALSELRSHQKDCSFGRGFDRVMLWLHTQYTSRTGHPHPLFALDCVKHAYRYRISTSQATCRLAKGIGFTPSEDDGYGICYSFGSAGGVTATVVCGPSSPTSAKDFAAVIAASLYDLHQLLPLPSHC
mmetsp:Transcript_5594/g.13013  ORF Transcript_5594/g.13013 Transcript_5594/m.13013 type:complete len:373 (-) Transcript_5594:6-1124(-)